LLHWGNEDEGNVTDGELQSKAIVAANVSHSLCAVLYRYIYPLFCW
jgi:hypothetical protein